jgi:hypothetical protein
LCQLSQELGAMNIQLLVHRGGHCERLPLTVVAPR